MKKRLAGMHDVLKVDGLRVLTLRRGRMCGGSVGWMVVVVVVVVVGSEHCRSLSPALLLEASQVRAFSWAP